MIAVLELLAIIKAAGYVRCLASKNKLGVLYNILIHIRLRGDSAMNKRRVVLLGLCMAFVLTITSGVMAQDAPTHLKIGYSTWVGYGPLFIAQEKAILLMKVWKLNWSRSKTPKIGSSHWQAVS